MKGRHLSLALLVLLCRSIIPSLLMLLQHPVEARRVYAAQYASLLDAASDTMVSALLSSGKGLSTLLTRLSGDDTPEARSSYAELIACCVAHCDAAALKKISDSGAVPYLLKLLREADSGNQQHRVVRCLEVGMLPTLLHCVCMHVQRRETTRLHVPCGHDFT